MAFPFPTKEGWGAKVGDGKDGWKDGWMDWNGDPGCR